MIIVINGEDGSGKSTVIEEMNKHLPGIKYSWSEFAKDMLYSKGIDAYSKEDKMRKCVSEIIDVLDELDATMDDVVKVINDCENGLYDGLPNLYLGVRNPHNIAKIRVYCGLQNIDFCSIYVSRNQSDEELSKLNYRYDHVIRNNGTLEKLKLKAYDTAYCLEKEFKVVRQ